MNRFVVRDERTRWLATILVCVDGLVTVYGMRNGTFGYCWAGTWESRAICGFLADIDAKYAARMFTHYLPRGRKTEGQQYIERIWPNFVEMLRASPEVRA